MPAADFKFDVQSDIIWMNSTGAYSFSVVILNTTCVYVYSSQYYTSNRNQKIYMGIMIVFLTLFTILMGGLVWICVKNRCLRKKVSEPYDPPDLRDVMRGPHSQDRD